MRLPIKGIVTEPGKARAVLFIIHSGRHALAPPQSRAQTQRKRYDALRLRRPGRVTGDEWRDMTLDEAMVAVWRDALAEGKPEVELEGRTFAVRTTPRKRLKEVDFEFDGQALRGLEQNPKTESRWAQLARKGHKVMQFLEAGRYVGVVVDGKATLYGRKKGK